VSGWLLDTDVISELRKPRPEPKVMGFIARQSLDNLFVSEVTFAEIRFGIERMTSPARRAEIKDWLSNKLRPTFGGNMLPITEDVILKWRLMVEEGRKAGYTFAQPDLFIAATALHHGLTVVTRNVDDYRMARVLVLNPWKDKISKE
jgi:predicted nucleic acid-binding protein